MVKNTNSMPLNTHINKVKNLIKEAEQLQLSPLALERYLEHLETTEKQSQCNHNDITLSLDTCARGSVETKTCSDCNKLLDIDIY